MIKVNPNPKYIFRQINLCTCSKRIALFFFGKSPSVLTFLKAAKVTKSSHHLLHDRDSEGNGSIPDMTSQTDLHLVKSL